MKLDQLIFIVIVSRINKGSLGIDDPITSSYIEQVLHATSLEMGGLTANGMWLDIPNSIICNN